MFLKHKKILFLFILLGLFLFEAGFVFAIETEEYPEILGIKLSEQSTLPEYVVYFFNLGMTIAVSLAALVIVIGGIYWIVSMGVGKITHEGKEWVMAGIKGLVLLLCTYLIAVTINPKLISPSLNELLPVSLKFGEETSPSFKEIIPTITYQEIPIGTLTETTLTRTIDCYDFDGSGDPIDGDPKTNDYEPTFMDHDRVDCLVKLGEAIERKAVIFKDLSEKIAELMEECTCFGICDLNCTTCSYSGPCPRSNAEIGTNTPCKGNCVNSVCKGNKDCCPPGVKEKIEHGPIILEKCPNCKTNCQTKCEKEFEEKQKRECDQNCKNQCEKNCQEECEKEYKGLDEFRSQYANILGTVETEIIIKERKVKIIKKDVWDKLRLIDQLNYLKEKLKESKKSFSDDLNNLKNAETKLSECYLSKAYVDFLKLDEETKKEEKKIVVQKIFKDPVTEKLVNISRYCKGYQYANSQCFHTCRNMCPGTMQEDFNCYKGTPICKADDKKCLESQLKKMKECTDKSKCVENSDGYSNFNQCMEVCEKKCIESCSEKEGVCPQASEECEKKCKEDSACLWNIEEEGKNGEKITGNEENCYFNFKELKKCADDSANLNDFKNCAELSFGCKYCTDQYPGDPDCLKKPGSEYSSSYLYQNPDLQKCQKCTEPIKIKDEKTGKETSVACTEIYPETWKCPPCSRCPNCTCTSQVEPGVSYLYQLCGADCVEFAHNDDPLTFYCRTDWWYEEKPKTPLGKEMICLKDKEIPIGRTIDETEKWVKELLDLVNKFLEKTENMVEYINQIGKEKNYCECDSKCDGSETACKGDCIFWQQQVPIFDEDGNQIGTKWVCGCNTQPCDGNPCQKIINLLLGKQADDKCPKGTEYPGVGGHYDIVKEAFEKLKEFATKESRSEILKRLIYSRKKMDEGSGIFANFKGEIKLLPCQRVEDEIIFPIREWRVIIDGKTLKNHCYGKKAGIILGTSDSLADNWFYCEKVLREEKKE